MYLRVARSSPVIRFASFAAESVDAGASIGSHASAVVHAPPGAHGLSASGSIKAGFAQARVGAETNATVQAADLALNRTHATGDRHAAGRAGAPAGSREGRAAEAGAGYGVTDE